MQNEAISALGAGPSAIACGLDIGGLGGPLALGDAVVHPAHGVGQFEGIDADEFDGLRMEFLRLFFTDRRMTLRVPVAKVGRNGLRRPMAPETLARVMNVLSGTPRNARGIWTRRAIELAAKVNSGDPVVVAEVLRDLGRHAGRAEQPAGERHIFEQAMARLAGEIAALEGITCAGATARILELLQRSRPAA